MRNSDFYCLTFENANCSIITCLVGCQSLKATLNFPSPYNLLSSYPPPKRYSPSPYYVLQFLLYSSPPPRKKISSSKYFPFPVLLIDNEYGRISVEISGHFELWLRIYATGMCFVLLYFLLICQLICSTYYVDGVTVII